MNLGKVKEVTNDFIKSLIWGKSDSRTAPQCLPHGIDSKPVKGAISVYCLTENKGKAVTLGYILPSDKTNIGETRVFATDENGNEVFSILLKNDGTCEFGGNTDNMVRYSELNTGLKNQDTDINKELGKIAAVLNSLAPGSYVVKPVVTDISASKINNIKTN